MHAHGETVISVLITRPRAEAETLVRVFRAAGCRGIVYPVLDFAPPEDTPSAVRLLQSALPAERVIWPSAAAIRFTLDLVPVSQLNSAVVVVPGPGTASAARAAGLTRVISPRQGFDSDAMLALPELNRIASRRILICNAPGGRRLLAQVLERRGADVTVVPVYRRVVRPPPAAVEAALHTAGRLVTLISSAAALEGLQSQLDAASLARIWSCPVVVISRRLAALARRAGAGHVAIAPAVTEEALVRTVLEAASSAAHAPPAGDDRE